MSNSGSVPNNVEPQKSRKSEEDKPKLGTVVLKNAEIGICIGYGDDGKPIIVNRTAISNVNPPNKPYYMK